MQDYRVYILGPDDHVQSRVDLRCSKETEAIQLAKAIRRSSRRGAMATQSTHRDLQAHLRATDTL